MDKANEIFNNQDRAGLSARFSIPTERALEADETFLDKFKKCSEENENKLRKVRNLKDLVSINVSHVPTSARKHDEDYL